MNVQRLAAFCDGDRGGNPAGIVIAHALPSVADMQRVAAEVGYSETAFAAPEGDAWRVRYFAPEAEVPFCGHATVALGAALAMRAGDGTFALRLRDATITVDGASDGPRHHATLSSPPTWSVAADADAVHEALALFALDRNDLDWRIPPALVHAGADHLVVMLNDRARLAAMTYDLPAGRTLMGSRGWVTILLGHVDGPRRFSTRNAFAYGGVLEDPATGAATAALAGYLRDLGWPHDGAIEVRQGDDMGMPSRLQATIPPEPGSAVRVSGTVRSL